MSGRGVVWRLIALSAAIAACLSVAPSALAGKSPVTGGVFTTVNETKDGTGRCKNGSPNINCNHYTDKRFVWLNGGPASNGRELRRYWRPRYQGTLNGTREELADGLLAEFERSVARRLPQRPSGVILSGGLDSSIVTTIASHQREPELPLRTYSTVFPGRSFDEGWKVKSLTDFLGIEPRTFTVEPQGSLWLALKHVQRWGLPLMGAGAVVEMPVVHEAAREGVEVLLDGQTGDETLGFAPYLVSDMLRQGRLLAALRLTGRWPAGRPGTLRERRWVLKNFGLKGALPHRLGNAAMRLRNRDRDPGPPWLTSAWRRAYVEQQDAWAWKADASGPRWWRHLSDTIVEAPHRELRMDYLRHRGAGAGIVNDSPLYDFDLVDYCLKLPPELAFASEHSRPLARHAVRDLMPDEVRLTHKKADFSSFCFEILTNADAPGIERLLNAPHPEIGAYVDMDWVRNLWRHERPGPGNHTGFWGAAIWLIVASECWLRAQADPDFVESMLAHSDVRSPSLRRVSLADNGTFFHLADSKPPV